MLKNCSNKFIKKKKQKKNNLVKKPTILKVFT